MARTGSPRPEPKFEEIWILRIPFGQLANAEVMAKIAEMEVIYQGFSDGHFTWYLVGATCELASLAETLEELGILMTDVSHDERDRQYVQGAWKRNEIIFGEL